MTSEDCQKWKVLSKAMLKQCYEDIEELAKTDNGRKSHRGIQDQH